MEQLIKHQLFELLNQNNPSDDFLKEIEKEFKGLFRKLKTKKKNETDEACLRILKTALTAFHSNLVSDDLDDI